MVVRRVCWLLICWFSLVMADCARNSTLDAVTEISWMAVDVVQLFQKPPVAEVDPGSEWPAAPSTLDCGDENWNYRKPGRRRCRR